MRDRFRLYRAAGYSEGGKPRTEWYVFDRGYCSRPVFKSRDRYPAAQVCARLNEEYGRIPKPEPLALV